MKLFWKGNLHIICVLYMMFCEQTDPQMFCEQTDPQQQEVERELPEAQVSEECAG